VLIAIEVAGSALVALLYLGILATVVMSGKGGRKRSQGSRAQKPPVS
jgi:hypothetical protein